MNVTKKTNKTEAWLFYDGECPVCRRWVARIRPTLEKHHFQFSPQQSEFAQKTLGTKTGEILPEMKVLTADGVLLGGADALVHVGGFVSWAKPLVFLAKLPGGMLMMRPLYRWFASRRSRANCGCNLCNTPL